MRPSKRLVVVCLSAMVLVSTVTVAGAVISSSSGSVVQLNSPPASVKLNALEHATRVHAFTERENVTLASAVVVDAVNPGTYSSFPSGSATVAAGTVVDSHLIHSDIPSGDFTVRRQGSVTFTGDIVGVIASTNRLASSDAALGAPGTLYAGSANFRGLEGAEFGFPSVADKLTISANRRTVTFDVRTFLIDEIRVITRHADTLTTTITDAPDPVTAGNDIQYTLTVTNTGVAPVANVHVVDTLPAGTTLVSATAPNGCTGTGPVDCSLGTLAVNASAQAVLVVTSPSTVPPGGTITNSAVATPGSNTQAQETTTIEAPEEGVSKGFVSPGGSLSIDSDNPATLTLPNTGEGAPVLITQGEGTFCDGPCEGPTTTINDFSGYSDPNNPITLVLTYNFTDITEAAEAYGSQIYKNDNPAEPNEGVPVADCTTQGGGVAIPHPCVDAHTIADPAFHEYVVTFTIRYISGDPSFGRR